MSIAENSGNCIEYFELKVLAAGHGFWQTWQRLNLKNNLVLVDCWKFWQLDRILWIKSFNHGTRLMTNLADAVLEKRISYLSIAENFVNCINSFESKVFIASHGLFVTKQKRNLTRRWTRTQKGSGRYRSLHPFAPVSLALSCSNYNWSFKYWHIIMLRVKVADF